MAKQSAYFNISGMTGKRNIEQLKKGLDEIPGVLSVSAGKDKKSLAVDFDDTGTGTQQLAGQICQLGYQVREASSQRHPM